MNTAAFARDSFSIGRNAVGSPSLPEVYRTIEVPQGASGSANATPITIGALPAVSSRASKPLR